MNSCIRGKTDMTETPKINEKAPIRLWQVIAEVLGSAAGVCFFIETLLGVVSGIIGVDSYGLIVAMELLFYISVPSVFAFPIVIRKMKLLIIPSTLLSLVIVIYSFDSFPEILSPFIGVVILSAFGVMAGELFNLFRSRRSKAKILYGITGSLSLLTPVLFMGYIYTGFLLHSISGSKLIPFVGETVREYVAETYADFNIVVGRTIFDWYDDKYITYVHDESDEDIYFEIWYITETSQYNPTNIIDRYDYGEFRNSLPKLPPTD